MKPWNAGLRKFPRMWPPDKRFVYWLLGATGICTVPLSGFCSSLMGFRTTLLEQNNEKRIQTYKTIAKAIETYLNQN